MKKKKLTFKFDDDNISFFQNFYRHIKRWEIAIEVAFLLLLLYMMLFLLPVSTQSTLIDVHFITPS